MDQMTEKDKIIWEKAKRRVSFRKHLFTYIIINGFFWAIWFFTGRPLTANGLPWPLWSMLGWGIGLAFNFYHAYIDNKVDAVQKEYDKLKNSKN